MPFVKRYVEPVNLNRNPLPEELQFDLDAISNNAFVGALKQLTSLVKHADDIFSELGDEVWTVIRRAESLKSRVDNVTEAVKGLNSKSVPVRKSDPYCEVSMGVQEHRTPVINSCLNPKWNSSMQFTVKDLHQDVLCFTVYDQDLFTPNDFLGRTEIKVYDIYKEGLEKKGPITKRLRLLEIETGEVVVKLDLHLFQNS